MSLFDQLFIYHPDPWQDRDWARLSGLPLEDVWFQAADGARLFGWYVEASATSAAMLWCHGNAGNIINRLENLRELYRLGLSVFIFDYRGYGRSQGARRPLMRAIRLIETVVHLPLWLGRINSFRASFTELRMRIFISKSSASCCVVSASKSEFVAAITCFGGKARGSGANELAARWE